MATIQMRMPGPWTPLCQADELAFRTACNAAVLASARPVKRRVIERLSESSEADRVFSMVWQAATNQSPPPIEQRFFDELSKSPLWSTLVVEAIAEERKWKDVFSNSEFPSLADRMRAFFEKFFGKDAGTLTKVASTAIAGAGSLVIATQINPEILHKVTLPIEVELKGGNAALPVRFIFNSKADSIPITLRAPNGTTTIPVRFEASADDKPLKLHFESDGKGDNTPAAALNLVASRLDQTNTSITATAAQLTNLVNLTSNSNENSLIKRLGDVNGAVRDLTGDFNAAVKSAIDTSSKNSDEIAAKLNLVAKTTIVPSHYRVTKLQPNSAQTVLIPIIDADDHRTDSVKITLCTREMDMATGVQLKVFDDFKRRNCDDGGEYHSTLPGGEVPTVDGLWTATVNSYEHHWYGNRSATVTLSPAQKPLTAATPSDGSGGLP
jgi:hypothetical protein